jgi:hypothetical protein
MTTLEDQVTEYNWMDTKMTPPTGYTFSAKKMTELACKRLAGYWLHCAHVNAKDKEIKEARAKGDQDRVNRDYDWKLKYSNGVLSCFCYLKNNGFLKKAKK